MIRLAFFACARCAACFGGFGSGVFVERVRQASLPCRICYLSSNLSSMVLYINIFQLIMDYATAH